MKVLFDHQIYSDHEYGGVARYFYEVSKQLSIDFNIDVVNTVRLSNNIFTDDPIFKSSKFFPNTPFRGKNRLLKSFNELYTRCLLTNDYDVFHPTYFDTYFLGALKNKPFVITFYDLIQEKFSHQFEKLNEDTLLFERRRLLLEKASKVIAISDSTKNDIIDIYKINSAKIEVVHLASSLNNNVADSNVSYNNYILYVGRRATYKNFMPFIEAVAPLLIKERQLKILCAGGGKFNLDEINLFQTLKITGRVIQVSINDQLLTALYKNALFFVLPSIYEGFGIPVLEAFSCSCAALLSNTSSLPEVGDDAALYFNPHDKEDMLDMTSRMLYDSELICKLKNAGLERQKLFSWSKTANDHYEIYKMIT